MGLGTGAEMLEQSAGFAVAAFEISGFSAMSDDIPGGGDQLGIELQRLAMAAIDFWRAGSAPAHQVPWS